MNDDQEKSPAEKAWSAFGFWICAGLTIFAAPMSYDFLEPFLRPMLNEIYAHKTAEFLDGAFKVILWPVCFFGMRASMITALSYGALYGGSRAMGFA